MPASSFTSARRSMCAHGGQAQPTVPNPRVLVSGQPTVTIAAPVRRRRLPVAAAAGRQRPLRDRAVDHGRGTRARRTASRCCCVDSQAVCAPDGHAAR